MVENGASENGSTERSLIEVSPQGLMAVLGSHRRNARVNSADTEGTDGVIAAFGVELIQ